MLFKSKRALYTMLAVLLLMLGAMTVYGLLYFLNQPLRQVKIYSANPVVSQQAVENVLKPLTHTKLLKLNLAKIQSQLQTLPGVGKVVLARIYPHTLQVRLDSPAMLGLFNGNVLLEDGSIVPPRKDLDTSSLLNISASDHDLPKVLGDLPHFRAILKRGGLKLKGISYTDWGLYQLQLSDGVHLVLGRAHQAYRLALFTKVYPDLKAEHKASINRVDMRYKTGLALA